MSMTVICCDIRRNQRGPVRDVRRNPSMVKKNERAASNERRKII